MKELLLQVEPDEAKMRLDLFLTDYALRHDLGLSRTNIQKLIHEEKVFLNSKIVDKPHHKLNADKISHRILFQGLPNTRLLL